MITSEKLTYIADNMPKVYEAGKTEGIVDGIKSEYDKFWDAYQENGTRRNYDYGFSYYGWYNENFKPKYNMIPTAMAYTFAYSNLSVNLVELLDSLGVKLDTSNSVRFQYAFAVNNMTHLPKISTVSNTYGNGLDKTFIRAKFLQSIEELELKSDGSQKFPNTFSECTSLTHIVITGTIGEDINFQDCPLSVDSMVSILSHLQNFNLTNLDKYGTQTVYFNDDCWSRLEAAQIETPIPEQYGTDWKSYLTDSIGWNY